MSVPRLCHTCPSQIPLSWWWKLGEAHVLLSFKGKKMPLGRQRALGRCDSSHPGEWQRAGGRGQGHLPLPWLLGSPAHKPAYHALPPSCCLLSLPPEGIVDWVEAAYTGREALCPLQGFSVLGAGGGASPAIEGCATRWRHHRQVLGGLGGLASLSPSVSVCSPNRSGTAQPACLSLQQHLGTARAENPQAQLGTTVQSPGPGQLPTCRSTPPQSWPAPADPQTLPLGFTWALTRVIRGQSTALLLLASGFFLPW